jgi:hypothetical protein
VSARLPAKLLVTALMRRAQQEGGNAAVLARGDAQAGGIFLIITERGAIAAILEQGYDLDGLPVWRDAAPQVLGGKISINHYLTKMRQTDPDLWFVELDVADSQQFVAQVRAGN